MGDRANIRIQSGTNPPLYFYTHWAGTELPKILQNALIRGKDRWNDEQYLNRIIFCEMIKGDVDGLNGILQYGISTFLGDNEHPIIEVDINQQKIKIKDSLWTFSEYITENI